MPYESPRQSRFIHAKAGEGVAWAKKFVADSHGTKVRKVANKSVKAKLSLPRKPSLSGPLSMFYKPGVK